MIFQKQNLLNLRNANDVYLDIYKKAREKAKNARNEAIKAYLEVKRIKELYMLDVADSSDDEEMKNMMNKLINSTKNQKYFMFRLIYNELLIRC